MSRAARSEKIRARGALLVVGLFVALTGAMLLVPSAAAQSDKYVPDETVSPTIIITGSPSEPAVPPQDSRIPFTGADLSLFVATGAAAVGTGAVIVRRTRRKREDDAE